MIRLLLKAACCWLAACAASQSLAALPADKLYAMSSPSVWRVFAYDAKGTVFSQGSAVVIGKETLLTNCHVLAKSKGFFVKHENQSFDAKLQHIDIERDMCQIAARNLTAPPLKIGDSDKLTVGQRVYALGSPSGLELTLSDGLISALRKDDNMRLLAIQISAPISHGSSGGALLDEEGRLIGITTATFRGSQNLNLAIPINWLRDLPERSAAALAKFATDGKTGASTAASAPGTRHKPVPSGYADINDLDKVAQINPRARAAYEAFLTRPFPRAFAFSEKGGWWASWGTKPMNPSSATEPAERVIPDCENYHHLRCHVYAIDDVVVYTPPQK